MLRKWAFRLAINMWSDPHTRMYLQALIDDKKQKKQHILYKLQYYCISEWITVVKMKYGIYFETLCISWHWASIIQEEILLLVAEIFISPLAASSVDDKAMNRVWLQPQMPHSSLTISMWELSDFKASKNKLQHFITDYILRMLWASQSHDIKAPWYGFSSSITSSFTYRINRGGEVITCCLFKRLFNRLRFWFNSCAHWQYTVLSHCSPLFCGGCSVKGYDPLHVGLLANQACCSRAEFY